MLPINFRRISCNHLSSKIFRIWSIRELTVSSLCSIEYMKRACYSKLFHRNTGIGLCPAHGYIPALARGLIFNTSGFVTVLKIICQISSEPYCGLVKRSKISNQVWSEPWNRLYLGPVLTAPLGHLCILLFWNAWIFRFLYLARYLAFCYHEIKDIRKEI